MRDLPMRGTSQSKTLKSLPCRTPNSLRTAATRGRPGKGRRAWTYCPPKPRLKFWYAVSCPRAQFPGYPVRCPSPSAAADGNPKNDTMELVSRVATEADLSAEETTHPNPITAGTFLLRRLRVVNHGASDARGVVVKDRKCGATVRPSLQDRS